MHSSVDTINQKALFVLNNSLTNNSKWVKVHAAEYLIKLKYNNDVLKEFIKEEKIYNKEPQYRIGVWRVLVEAEQNKDKKKFWLEKIYEVYKNPNSPDRLHATETLAKLSAPVDLFIPEITASSLKSADKHMQLYAFWASTNSSKYLQEQSNTHFIEITANDHDILMRKISSYILRYRNNLTPEQWQILCKEAIQTPANNKVYVNLLTTALVTAPKNIRNKSLEDASVNLLKNINGYDVSEFMDICNWLAEKGGKNNLPLLEKILDDKSVPTSAEKADLSCCAAYAILKINGRNENKK